MASALTTRLREQSQKKNTPRRPRSKRPRSRSSCRAATLSVQGVGTQSRSKLLVGPRFRRPAKVLDCQHRVNRRRRTVLSFPNQSRVFDPTRRAVRFWGHDSAMEWSFFVTEDALRQVDPAVAGDEDAMLG